MNNQFSISLTEEQKEKVQRLHREEVIIDTLEYSTPDLEYLEVLKSVGMKALHYTVSANNYFQGNLVQDSFIMACQKIGRWYSLLEEFKDRIELAVSIKEMERINKEGKIAILFGFQNGSPLEDNADYVKVFKKLGVSIIMLTYNSRNMIGDGCGEPNDAGLSDFGHTVIQKMNQVGMVVDLSHCGYRTTMEAIEASKDPVLFTHANARSFSDEPRNKTDEQIKALVKKGGVICVKAILGNMIHKKAEEATVADVVDLIQHLVQMVGIDHVGIGTDYRGTIKNYELSADQIKSIKTRWKNAYPGARVMPQGFATIADLPNLTGVMVQRGFADEDMKKILGGNVKRLLEGIIG